jgi:cytochrome c556
MKIVIKSALIITAVAIIAGIAHAQFAKPEDAIRYRKSVMILIVHHFKQMGAVVQGKASYDKASFEDNAKLLHILSTLPWDAFMTPGSDKGDTDLKSSALKDKDAFMKVAKDFENATKDLMLAAAGGDLGKIKTEFGASAQSCKACHGPYRK